MTKTITILGAGVIGLTSAYHLAKEGYAVTVIETAPAPATQASGGNGAQLSYGHLAPPFTMGDVFSKLNSLLFGTNPQTDVAHLYRSSVMQNIGWFMKAALQTLPFNYRRNLKKIITI